MRSQEVVVLQNRESGQNVPHEFIIAAVDETGKLRQYGGIDDDIAGELLGIIDNGCSLVVRDSEAQQRLRILKAQSEGDVPEEMPRNLNERYGPAPPAGDPAEKPQGLGQRPVPERET